MCILEFKQTACFSSLWVSFTEFELQSAPLDTDLGKDDSKQLKTIKTIKNLKTKNFTSDYAPIFELIGGPGISSFIFE